MRAARALPAILRTRQLELATMAGPVVTLLASVLIARSVGPTGRGEVVLVATWAQLAGWAGGLSVDKALITAAGSVDPRRRDMPLAAGLSVLFSAGTVAALGAAALIGLVIDDPVVRLLMFLATLGTAAVDARAAALIRAGRWVAYTRLRYGQPLVYLAGCALVTGLARLVPGAVGARAFVLALCVSLWLPALLVGGWPRLRPRRPTGTQVRVLLSFAGAYHLGLVLHLVNTRIDIMIMPIRFTAAEIGIYAVACSAGQVVALMGQVSLIRGLAGQVGPPVDGPTGGHVPDAGHASATDRVPAAGRVPPTDRTGLLIVVALAAFAAATVGWLVPALYGPAFAAAIGPARLLCLGGVLLYLMHGLNGLLAGRDRPWSTVWVNAAGGASFTTFLIFADTLADMAAANVASTAVALAVAWQLNRSRRPESRKADRCVSELTLPPSSQGTQPASRPSPSASSTGSPTLPSASSR